MATIRKKKINKMIVIDGSIESDIDHLNDQNKLQQEKLEEIRLKSPTIQTKTSNRDNQILDENQNSHFKISKKVKLQCGNFHLGDRIQYIQPYQLGQDDSERLFKIFWKKRSDGIQPRESFADYEELKHQAPYKIIQWWEGLWDEASKYLENSSQIMKTENEACSEQNQLLHDLFQKSAKNCIDIEQQDDYSNTPGALIKQASSAQVENQPQQYETIKPIQKLLRGIQNPQSRKNDNQQHQGGQQSDELTINVNQRYVQAPQSDKNSKLFHAKQIFVKNSKINAQTDAQLLLNNLPLPQKQSGRQEISLLDDTLKHKQYSPKNKSVIDKIVDLADKMKNQSSKEIHKDAEIISDDKNGVNGHGRNNKQSVNGHNDDSKLDNQIFQSGQFQAFPSQMMQTQIHKEQMNYLKTIQNYEDYDQNIEIE